MGPSHEFQVTYPCYILLHKCSVVFDKKGQAVRYAQPLVFVSVETKIGERALPVFTDEDLASRFMDASAGLECVCISVINEEELTMFLEAAKDSIPTVVFDLSAQPRGQIESGQPNMWLRKSGGKRDSNETTLRGNQTN